MGNEFLPKKIGFSMCFLLTYRLISITPQRWGKYKYGASIFVLIFQRTENLTFEIKKAPYVVPGAFF